jgi:hypothetical protein
MFIEITLSLSPLVRKGRAHPPSFCLIDASQENAFSILGSSWLPHLMMSSIMAAV